MLQDTRTINNSDVSTGFFGKLPGFTDFIKYNAAGKEIQTIDNWLQEGLALAKLKYKNEWKDHYNNTSSINFIYPFTGTDNTTIGVISPSNDKSGRCFPFIMFGNIKKNVYDDLLYYLIPSAYKGVFDSFCDIADVNKSIEETSSLKSLTDNVKLAGVSLGLFSNDYKKFISETKLCDILDKENGNQFDIKFFFENRLKISEHFVCFNFSSSSYEKTDSFMLSFYIQLLHKIFKSSDSIAGVFWTLRDDSNLQLFLYFAKPTPKDFIDLLFYDRNSPNSSDENTGDIKKEFRSMNSIFRDNSIVDGRISIIDFLNSIKKYIY